MFRSIIDRDNVLYPIELSWMSLRVYLFYWQKRMFFLLETCMECSISEIETHKGQYLTMGKAGTKKIPTPPEMS